MTKVDIFSGFLGAGKTTLIKKLIEEAYEGEKIVLIENEFGEIGVDSGFLKDTGVQINEMNSGCICCTLVGDFGRALNQVIEEYDPDRILIEPSGVGKLSDVIIAVRDLKNERIILNAAATVVDAKKCRIYMANFGEFYKNQVEHAGSIILSHTGGLNEEKMDRCVSDLRKLNESASIVTTSWDELDGGDILEIMEQRKSLSGELDKLKEEAHTHHDHDHDHHHDHGHDHDHHHADEIFDEVGAETAHQFTEEQVRDALGGLSNFAECGQVLRAKGIVAGENGKWIHFDYVPGEPEIREGAAETTGRICVIGVGLDEERIRELFGLA